MKRAAAAAIAVLLAVAGLGGAAGGEPTPFARSPATPTWSQMSLGNLMLLIQSRHAKIWHAGRAQDWALAEYELDHVSDDLTAAAMLYREIPTELVTGVHRIIQRMKEAAKRSDPSGFQTAFSDLTGACNACHAAGGVAFIRIQTPTSMPFSNQKILPSAAK